MAINGERLIDSKHFKTILNTACLVTSEFPPCWFNVEFPAEVPSQGSLDGNSQAPASARPVIWGIEEIPKRNLLSICRQFCQFAWHAAFKRFETTKQNVWNQLLRAFCYYCGTCMSVCLCVFLPARLYVCMMGVRMYACLYGCLDLFLYCMSVRSYANVYLCIYVCQCMPMYANVRQCMPMYAYMYAWLYMHTWFWVRMRSTIAFHQKILAIICIHTFMTSETFIHWKMENNYIILWKNKSKKQTTPPKKTTPKEQSPPQRKNQRGFVFFGLFPNSIS